MGEVKILRDTIEQLVNMLNNLNCDEIYSLFLFNRAQRRSKHTPYRYIKLKCIKNIKNPPKKSHDKKIVVGIEVTAEIFHCRKRSVILIEHNDIVNIHRTVTLS